MLPRGVVETGLINGLLVSWWMDDAGRTDGQRLAGVRFACTNNFGQGIPVAGRRTRSIVRWNEMEWWSRESRSIRYVCLVLDKKTRSALHFNTD